MGLRFWPAVFGVLTVLQIWPLRRKLGLFGTPVAAFCLALSPGLVYYSRDFIHEMSFGYFSLALVVGALRYFETKNVRWLVFFAVAAGLLFATKETAIITAAVLILATLSALIWDLTRQQIGQDRLSCGRLLSALKSEVAGYRPSADYAATALLIFVLINFFLYSSFLTHWRGIPDAGRSIWLWTQRSGAEHVKSFWFYFAILLKLELPLLVGSLAAGIFIIRRGTRFWLFAAAWSLGMTLAYSMIGYKTPWLMVSFLIPLSLVCGYAAEQIYGSLPWLTLKLFWTAAIMITLLFCSRLSWKVNFDRPDDNDNRSGYFSELGQKYKIKPYTDTQAGYVYAQTDRDFLNLVEAIRAEIGKLPPGASRGLYVASPDYWPLPWYLRDFQRIVYPGNLPSPLENPAQISEPIILASVNQQAGLNRVKGLQPASRAFTLRPGVDLVLYVKQP